MKPTEADLRDAMRLTPDELRAIRSLKRLAKRWPASLWLFSASGSLCVMRLLNGTRAITPQGGVDPDLCVATIEGISNDGGDW